jgi:hypothetical protein
MAAATSLTELSAHLQKVQEDPTTQLDTGLLEQCELFTSTPDFRNQIWKDTQPLFLQIAALLPKLQQDPSPLTRFIIKMAEPYRFQDIKDVEFEIGLDLQAVPFHGLLLTLLGKATANSVDAHALANRPTVMASIVRLWLCTSEAGVATQAEQLLTSLLQVSKNEPGIVSTPDPSHAYGTGPVWRRLFGDRDIASMYYQYTSLKDLTSLPSPQLNKRDKTIAQARLLSWLPRVGRLDWTSLVSSHVLNIEQEVGLKEGQGLLHYAALKMVDTAGDMLMHMTLINFFSELITAVNKKPHLTHYDSSLALDFVQKEGIHKGIVDFHTSENPSVEHAFLSNRTAHYISEYASMYPENFEKSDEMPTIRIYVHRNMRKCEASTLNMLAAMPRSTLIPRHGTDMQWDDCILLDMPITRTNPDALKALATIFHGPPREELTYPQVESVGADQKRQQTESVFARLLTALFYAKKPNMFADIVRHIDTIAMQENALAALGLVQALITANWSSDTTVSVPSNFANFPKTGLELILDPSLSGSLLTTLLKPAITFSNLVGGLGDAENAAYKVATAKFEVLKALGRKLEETGSRDDVLTMVRRRVGEGIWGERGGVGSRIGTMEL